MRQTASSSLHAFAVTAAMACPSGAHAAGITDPVGDFLPTFAGSPASTDLDVIDATVVYNTSANTFTLTSTQAGNVGLTPTGFYIWGVNKGSGTAGFGATLNRNGILFDSVVRLNNNSTGSIGANPLPSGSVTISGPVISATFSATLLPSTGFLPQNYTWNLWPRDGAFSGNTAISDFAPNNANFTATVVPEPASVVLMLTGVGALALGRRSQRAPG